MNLGQYQMCIATPLLFLLTWLIFLCSFFSHFIPLYSPLYISCTTSLLDYSLPPSLYFYFICHLFVIGLTLLLKISHESLQTSQKPIHREGKRSWGLAQERGWEKDGIAGWKALWKDTWFYVLFFYTKGGDDNRGWASVIHESDFQQHFKFDTIFGCWKLSHSSTDCCLRILALGIPCAASDCLHLLSMPLCLYISRFYAVFDLKITSERPASSGSSSRGKLVIIY